MHTARTHERRHCRPCFPRAPGEVGEIVTLGHLIGVKGDAEPALVGQASDDDEAAAVVRRRGDCAGKFGNLRRKPHLPHPCLTFLSISNPLFLLCQVREVRKVR